MKGKLSETSFQTNIQQVPTYMMFEVHIVVEA